MGQDSFFPARAIMKELNVSFAFVYTKADFEFTIEMLGRERSAAAGLVTDHVGIDAFPAACEAPKHPSNQIKVLLRPD